MWYVVLREREGRGGKWGKGNGEGGGNGRKLGGEGREGEGRGGERIKREIFFY